MPSPASSVDTGVVILIVGRIRVDREHVAQRVPQRIQPWLVVAPMIDAFAEYGLAHLLRTRGSHRPVVVVKAQASRFECQPAMCQKPAHFALRIVDHVLVDDAVNFAWKYLVEVGHEFHIVAVIPGNVLKAVSVSLALREVLLEAREATSHRVAAGIDDLRMRECQPNESYVLEIIGHFIDEERLPNLALNPSLFDVLLAERAALGGVHRGQYPGIC